MMRSFLTGLALCSMALLTACNQETPAQKMGGVDGAKYLLAEEPAGAIGVAEAREKTADKDDVVVVGRIGGHMDPWTKDRAAFFIADLSMKSCDEKENDSCPYPWDFCCELDLPKKRLLVQVVDDDGKILKHDARQLFNVKELQTVVVQGQAQRDKEGNLTVLARKVYVRK